MNLRHLGSMMLATPAVLLALAGPAPTHAAETTITDPLTGTTVATRRNGGELTPQGWKVTSKGTGIGQYLYYLLPAGVTSGVLTFEAMGFKFDKYPSNGGETEEREHMLGVFDQDEPHDPAADPIGFFIRFYDHKNIPGSFYPGSHRMRFDSPTFERQCDAKAPVIWSPTTWYQFKVEWNQTLVRWYKDNILQCSVSLLPIKKKGKILPGAPKVPLRHLYLGSDYRVLYYQPPNVTYRNVKIVVQ
jgi:hypothetical protein